MRIHDEAYSELNRENERLKTQHEEMLLKHAQEEGLALEAIAGALEEIARLKALLSHAADALVWSDNPDRNLIAQLRKAARSKSKDEEQQ